MSRSCQWWLTRTYILGKVGMDSRQDAYWLAWPGGTRPSLNACRHLAKDDTKFVLHNPKKTWQPHFTRLALSRSRFSRLICHWPDMRGYVSGYQWPRSLKTLQEGQCLRRLFGQLNNVHYGSTELNQLTGWEVYKYLTLLMIGSRRGEAHFKLKKYHTFLCINYLTEHADTRHLRLLQICAGR